MVYCLLPVLRTVACQVLKPVWLSEYRSTFVQGCKGSSSLAFCEVFYVSILISLTEFIFILCCSKNNETGRVLVPGSFGDD